MGLTKTLTVGELRKALEGVPDDANVKVQEFEGGRSTATGCEYQEADDDVSPFGYGEFVVGI